MANKLTIEQRVANGVRFLDEYVPDWLEKINTPELDVNDLEKCPLGQIFGHYDTAKNRLRVEFINSNISRKAMGFDLMGDDIDALRIDSARLTDEWKRVINERWHDN